MRRFLLSLFAAGLVAVGGHSAFAQTDNSYFVGAISKSAIAALGTGIIPTVNAATGTATLNLAAGTTLTTGATVGSSVYDETLTGAVTFTVSGFTVGAAQEITVILRQDATGGRVVTWPTAVKWSGGTAPTFVTTASTITVVHLVSDDGGATVIGFIGH